jgi:hypothetical protein
MAPLLAPIAARSVDDPHHGKNRTPLGKLGSRRPSVQGKMTSRRCQSLRSDQQILAGSRPSELVTRFLQSEVREPEDLVVNLSHGIKRMPCAI